MFVYQKNFYKSLNRVNENDVVLLATPNGQHQQDE